MLGRLFERLIERLYRLGLHLCPRSFREDYGDEVAKDFMRLAREAGHDGWGEGILFALRGLFDLLRTALREHIRGLSSDALRQDLRVAGRHFFGKPGFSIVVVVTLALGIGANSAIFALVYDVLLRPLPFPQAERLVLLLETDLARGSDGDDVTPANFEDWRALSRSFDHMAAVTETSANWTGDGEPERLSVARVSQDFFSVLGVSTPLGRVFVAEEDREGAAPVALLSHGLWTRRFGGRDDVVGRTIRLDDIPREIVGVLPSSFRFPNRGIELFVPFAMDAEERGARSSHYLDVVARRRSSVSLEEAREEMEAIAAGLAEQYPESNEDNGVVMQPLANELVGGARTPLLVLFAAVLAVLLIAVVNLANLFLARSAARRREVALRAALGASRKRLLAQLMTEAFLYGVAGGALGLVLGRWLHGFVRILAPHHVAADGTMFEPVTLVFTLLLSIAVAVGMGLLPALSLLREERGGLLRDGGVRGDTSGTSGLRAQSVLVVGEMALALVLLVMAGLMIQSFRNLTSLAPGFEPERVLTMRVELSGARYSEHSQKVRFFEELETRVTRLPGVVSAGFVTMLPLTATGGAIYFGIEDGPIDPGLEPAALFRSVSDDYFRTMAIPLREGRVFDVRDRLGAPAVVIVNETLARRYFPEDGALGHHLSVWGESSEIVGIVGDVQQLEFGAETRPALYVASPQRALGYFDPKDLAVRTTAEPEALAGSIRAEIWDLDPDQPIASVRTMNDIVMSSVTDERLQTSLLTVFGLVALSLAAIGVYGVQSYSVSLRTGEIGLRMALGAQAGHVLGMVTVHGMARATLGILFGVVGAIWSTRFLTGMLYGVAPSDPWTLVAISVALGGVAFGACLLPGLRATRIDPLIALRDS